MVDEVAKTNLPVLITGESGTGKELMAQDIHFRSQRRAKPFIRVNCAAFPAGLLESELFGYEKGAFTGANHKKPGKFEIANGGTLCLTMLKRWTLVYNQNSSICFRRVRFPDWAAI